MRNFVFLQKKPRGQSLIELLLAIAFSGIVLPVLLVAFTSSREGKVQREKRTEAVTLLRESQEAARIVRESGWSNLAADGTFHPVASASSWTFSPGIEVVNGYNRWVTIDSVYRDASTGAIVSSGGVPDAGTKKVTANVSWSGAQGSSSSATMYLTRYLSNTALLQTTVQDFNAGTTTDTTITNTSGGEVTLGPYGKGDWCSPNLTISAVDLPKSGVANAISAVVGNIVVGTGENSSGVSFANVDVKDTDPPQAQVSGTFDGYKTNDVFTDGQYAYLATDNNAKEIVILDLTQQNPVTGKYTEVGYFDTPGNDDGVSVFVPAGGVVGFATTSDSRLHSFNLSSKSGSRPLIASKTLAGVGSELVISGNYAYISIAGATQELQIVQFNADGTGMIITGYSDVNGEAAVDVSLNPDATRVYLATQEGSTKREFFILDTSSKIGARPIVGSYETNGMNPKGVTFVTYQKAILVGTSAEEYQVINITNEANPTGCGGMQINSGIKGIATVNEPGDESYSYIITGDASSELKIVEGGPGGIYINSGTFESSTMDAGSNVLFNRFTASVQLPSQTTVQFQVAIADPVSGSCANATFSFVGPDGTISTYFPTTGGSIPQNDNGSGFENPGRCVRYKAFLSTTDYNATPTITDVSINYSL